LLVCQLAGEVIARLASLPVPGPVLGMALLFAGLVVRGRVPPEMEVVGGSLLRYLSLLFVPAGVGVIVHLRLLAANLLPVAGAVTIGTLVTIALTGWLMQKLNRNGGHHR
jgi:holin-like protein